LNKSRKTFRLATVLTVLAGYAGCETATQKEKDPKGDISDYVTSDLYRQLGRSLALHALEMDFRDQEVDDLIEGFRAGLGGNGLLGSGKDADLVSKRIVERQVRLQAGRAEESKRVLKVVAGKFGSKLEGETNVVLARTAGVGEILAPEQVIDVHLEYGAIRADEKALVVRESRATSLGDLAPCLQSGLHGARDGEVVRIACQPGSFLAATGLPPVVFPGEMVMVTARLTLPNTVPDKTKSD
jgi:hypothetical protein